MKLAHIAQGLTIALLIATAWLAWQAQQEAASANRKLEQRLQQSGLRAQESASPSLIPGGSMPVQMAPLPPMPTAADLAPAPAPVVAAPASLPPLPKPLPEIATAPAPAKQQPAPGTAGSPAPAVAASATPPPPGPAPLTPLQRRVKDSPALGKVSEAVMDQGFVVLDTTAKQNVKPGMVFDLRRDSAVVGRVTVSSVEADATIANLDPKTVPAGLSVQAGDEVIAVINAP